MSEELIKNKECRAAFDEARKNRFGVHRLDVVCEPDIFRAGYAAALRATHPAPESAELLERAVYLLEIGDMDGPTARELRALLEVKP